MKRYEIPWAEIDEANGNIVIHSVKTVLVLSVCEVYSALLLAPHIYISGVKKGKMYKRGLATEKREF
jgi:hypothetical protein